jgi:hypothetical protein
MLCKAIPESRVFQFGYRPLQNEKLSATFYERMAKALVEKLSIVALEHPIIFIGCGDGGFVIEKAFDFGCQYRGSNIISNDIWSPVPGDAFRIFTEVFRNFSEVPDKH